LGALVRAPLLCCTRWCPRSRTWGRDGTTLSVICPSRPWIRPLCPRGLLWPAGRVWGRGLDACSGTLSIAPSRPSGRENGRLAESSRSPRWATDCNHSCRWGSSASSIKYLSFFEPVNEAVAVKDMSAVGDPDPALLLYLIEADSALLLFLLFPPPLRLLRPSAALLYQFVGALL
jgi:hypothetical protein